MSRTSKSIQKESRPRKQIRSYLGFGQDRKVGRMKMTLNEEQNCFGGDKNVLKLIKVMVANAVNILKNNELHTLNG